MTNKYIIHVSYRTAGLGVTAATATLIESAMPKHMLEEQYEQMAKRLEPMMTVNVVVVRV